MKKSEVKVGHVYVAKVSDRLVPVRIDSVHSRGGWNATNTKTGKRIHIKSAQRLRREAKPKGEVAAAKADQENARLHDERRRSPDGMAASERAMAASDKKATKPAKADAKSKAAKAKRTSALDAAAIVLKDVGRPLNCRELIEMMAARELWHSPNGKTPESTLYAAILRELKAKGDTARFRKVGRGQFEFNT